MNFAPIKPCMGTGNMLQLDDGQINLDENDYLMIGTLESYIKTKSTMEMRT